MTNIVEQGKAPPHLAAVLGTLSTAEGDFDTALLWLDKAIETDPENILAYGFRARAHNQMGNLASAKTDIAQAHAIAPSLEEFQQREQSMKLREKGESLFGEDQYTKALAAFVEALEADP
ncbi:MAG: hypothetical protein QGG73_05925 [Candidatus Hydrogenedentes bacterium]|nr:hypothetical protein [Candidatus Hydrogenedentota bacterium]